MRRLAFAAVLLAAAVTSLHAQGVSPSPADPGAAQPPAELLVAPVAPKREPEPPAPGGGTPANICQELVMFLEIHAAQGSAASAATPGGVAPTLAPQAQPQGRSSTQSGAPLVDEPQQKSGIVAPVPAPESGGKPPSLTPEQARALLAANDLRACQQAAQHMRRAGVPMPDGLIALAALSEDLLLQAEPVGRY